MAKITAHIVLGAIVVAMLAVLWAPPVSGQEPSKGTASGRQFAVVATPTPLVWPTPTPFTWPYRYNLSGPDSGHPGDSVAFRIEYEIVGAAGGGYVFDVRWTSGSASFVSLHSLTGEARIESQDPDGVLVAGKGGLRGAVEVRLRISPDFVGVMRVGIGLRGTGIVAPEGSVLEKLVTVSRPAAQPVLPVMGAPQRGTSCPIGRLVIVLSLIAAVSLGTGGAAFWRSVRKRVR